MKKYLYSTKIVLLLCMLTLIGWSSTFIPAAQKDHTPVLTTPVDDLLETELHKQEELESGATRIIDPQSLEELEIDRVAGVLDCTVTHLGSLAFKHALRHPTTNHTYLAQLQHAIRNLLDNPQLAEKLTQLLTTMKEIEPMLTVLLFSQDSIYDATTQQITPMPPLTCINSILELILSKEASNLLLPIDKARTIQSPLGLNLAFAGLTAADFALGIGIPFYWAYHNILKAFIEGTLLTPATYIAPLLIAGRDFWQRYKTTGLVKEHLKALFTYVEQLRAINTLLKENSYLFDVFPGLKFVTTFVERPEELSVNMRKISAHDGKISWLPSGTWCTYNTVKTEQKTMQLIFRTIGMLDFVLSLATLYKKFQTARVHFCFVTYQRPGLCGLHVRNAWHPLLDPETVVMNDIVLGSNDTASKMILTGPNKGKSTTLKLVALMELFASTITIVPASVAWLPIVDYIGVNTTTVVPDGVSESQAEIARMKTILDSVAALTSDRISLTVFDRLLRMEDLAKTYNHSIAHGLVKYPNNISIIATNNPTLKALEQDTQGAFVNFKITRRFTLERGTSSDKYDVPWPGDFLSERMAATAG